MATPSAVTETTTSPVVVSISRAVSDTSCFALRNDSPPTGPISVRVTALPPNLRSLVANLVIDPATM